jgi:predicted nucleic acid-binding protein
MDRVFVDTDIIIDLIQEREPFYQDAVLLFSLMEEKKVVGHVSPLIFANLYYILRKGYSKQFAVQVLTRLKALVRILSINEKTIELALSSGFKDFEDAIQYYSALEAKLKYLITRNKADYKKSGIIICTAKEYLSIRASMTSEV